jgi:hypothetical protein
MECYHITGRPVAGGSGLNEARGEPDSGLVGQSQTQRPAAGNLIQPKFNVRQQLSLELLF